MSLDREEQMLVMQLADGELDESERQRAMQLVERKPAAAALLAEMGFVGDWARESQREGQRERVIETFDVAAEMEAQVSSRAPMSIPLTHAVPSSRRSSVVVDRHEAHALVDLDAQRRRRGARRTQTMAVVGALAVAAAALFVVRAQDKTAAIEQQQQALAMQLDFARQQQAAAAGSGATLAAPPLTPPPASSLATAAGTAQGLGSGVTPVPRSDVEVNGVDAREHDVTVFYPPAGDPNSSVVVWIEDKK